MGETTPLGECKIHGYVRGDDVDMNFPNSAHCHCGKELKRVIMVEQTKLDRVLQNE